MRKDEAHREAIRRWRMLPPDMRKTFEDAENYAKWLDIALEFDSFTDKRKLIEAWLIRDLSLNGVAARIQSAA
jgi:hypothetical protein